MSVIGGILIGWAIGDAMMGKFTSGSAVALALGTLFTVVAVVDRSR
jgi:hypothetical protein